MLNLILAGIIGLVLIISLVIIIQNKPDLWFWLFLNLYFDPGGYVEGYLGGKLIGPLNVADIFFAGIIICLITARVNWKLIFGDLFLRKFLSLLLIFSLYYFIVYGGVVPYLNNDFNYTTFLIKSRVYIYGLIILVSVYVFSLRGLKYFYTITLTVGVICLSLYLITLLSGLNLVPVWKFARYGDEGMMRISILSYGLFDLVFPTALTAYLLSRKIILDLELKHLLYACGIMMIITEILTLTRRTQIDIIGGALIIVLIISYLFRMAKLPEILKIGIPAAVVILALFFTFPKYIDYAAKIAEDTVSLIVTGKDTRGQSDYRVSGTGDLNTAKAYISKNLLFGLGYTYWNYGEGYASSTRGATFASAADAAGEVPIYYLFFGFGIVGAALILPMYYVMARLFYKLIKLLRLTLIDYLQDPLTILFSVYFLFIIASKFTFEFYQIGQDFTGPRMSETAVFIGLGFALYRKILVRFDLV